MTVNDQEARPDNLGAGFPPSRQVAWFTTYTYVARIAGLFGTDLDDLPIPGTPAWCGMSDDDATKLLALLFGGVRDALNNDTQQAATAAASRAIAGSADWAQIARNHHRRNGIYIPRRAAS